MPIMIDGQMVPDDQLNIDDLLASLRNGRNSVGSIHPDPRGAAPGYDGAFLVDGPGPQHDMLGMGVGAPGGGAGASAAPQIAGAAAGPDATPGMGVGEQYGPPMPSIADIRSADASSAPAAAAKPAATQPGFLDKLTSGLSSPLTMMGLGILGGTSPFAAVNIGQGALQGIKAASATRETTASTVHKMLASGQISVDTAMKMLGMNIAQGKGDLQYMYNKNPNPSGEQT